MTNILQMRIDSVIESTMELSHQYDLARAAIGYDDPTISRLYHAIKTDITRHQATILCPLIRANKQEV